MPLIVVEPSAAYGERPRLVVDASVLAAALFAEAGREHALSWMRGRKLCAPHLVDCEITNVALAKVQRKALDTARARQALGLLSGLDLERHSVDAVAVFELASRTRLTAYDAAYLWLAGALNAPLATFDARLGAAALDHLREPKPD